MLIRDYVLRLQNLSIADSNEVGVKNAFLGEIFTHQKLHKIKVPEGFAITSIAFQRFIEYNKLDGVHDKLMAALDTEKPENIKELGKKARELIIGARMPGDISDSILAAYNELCAGSACEIAIRCSPILAHPLNDHVRDVHDTFLNVSGETEIINCVKKCFASLYSDKALLHYSSSSPKSIAVCVQKMVRSDKSSSGIVYTADPESGFADVIHINALYGILDKSQFKSQGPDEFIVYKPNISQGISSIIQKKMGSKNKMYVLDRNGVINLQDTPLKLREQYILVENEILKLAEWALTLEEYFDRSISLEWAKDAETDEIFLLQARPENFKNKI